MDQKPIKYHRYQELEVQGRLMREEALDAEAVRQASGERRNLT